MTDPTNPGQSWQPNQPAQPTPTGPPPTPGWGNQPPTGATEQGWSNEAPPYAPPPATPARKTGWLKTAVVVAIVAVVVIGFILFRDRLSNEVTSLQVGECFDRPAQGETEVSEVQRQPCNEPHDAEVIAVLVHTAGPSDAYPVVSGFNDFILEKCVPVFESFTGRTFASETELSLGYFQPTLTGWTGGDRGFTCYLSRLDESKLTGSLRAGTQAPSSP